MMRRFHVPKAMLPLAMTAFLFAACTADVPTSPASGPPALANWHHSGSLPGSGRHWGANGAPGCFIRNASYGEAEIGPSGGVLIVGPHHLIIPPGALQKKVLISGTVPAGKPFQIDLQPHGLQFKKPAGLVLDANDCHDVPNILYLIDQYTVSDPILAVYSNFWHQIACPIWHFSGYLVAFDDGSRDDGSGE